MDMIFWGRVIQRTIELLVFYFILSNIESKSLKEAFTQLFFYKEKVLYGSIILLIGYPLLISFVIQLLPEYGFLLDHVLRLFVAHFLVRLVSNLQKILLTYIFSLIIASTVSPFIIGFSLDPTMLIFLLTFTIVLIMTHQDYFEKIHVYLLKKKWLMNSAVMLSIIFYMATFFIVQFSTYSLLLLLILFLTAAIYLKNEDRLEILAITNQLKQAEYNDLIQLLKNFSSEYTENEVTHQYIIQNHIITELVSLLSKKLELHKRMGIIRDYEYITTKRQIEINIILKQCGDNIDEISKITEQRKIPIDDLRIVVKHQTGIDSVYIDNIMYIELINRKTKITLENGQELLTANTIAFWKKQLISKSFGHHSQSYIINFQHVDGIIPEEREITMYDGKKFIIPVRKVTEINNAFQTCLNSES